MKAIDFVTEKELRDQCVGRVEVLDKVKQLLLIPNFDGATTKMIADFYEVGESVVKMCYKRHKKEIDADGSELGTQQKFLKSQDVTIEKSSRYAIFSFQNGVSVIIPNSGTRVFSKRAVLRFGMLLRDSEVAKEVRTQLLNCYEELAPVEVVQVVDTEKNLQMDLVQAFSRGSVMDMMVSAKALYDYQKQHIQLLTHENKVLAKEIVEWTDRAKFNKAARVLSGMMQVTYGRLYNIVYNELLYKHGISLRQRRAMHGNHGSLLDYIKEEEWAIANSVLAAICENYGVSYEELLEKVDK